MGRLDDRPTTASGLNTEVDADGRCYHVQTQFSTRGAPVIESLVFQNGQTLVRITSSYDDIAREVGFNSDDGRHLLELQHDDLIRKIRHGMLRGDAADASPPTVEPAHRVIDSAGNTVDPSDVDEPGVRELLDELGVAIDAAIPSAESTRPQPQPARPPQSAEATSQAAARATQPARPSAFDELVPATAPVPWWRRFALTIRLPF